MGEVVILKEWRKKKKEVALEALAERVNNLVRELGIEDLYKNPVYFVNEHDFVYIVKDDQSNIKT